MSSISMFHKKNNPKENSAKSGVNPQNHLRSASKASKWVEQLPLTDMGETTRQMFVSLVGLNRQPLSPPVRIEITEIFSPYVQMCLNNLERHFHSRSFPLPERSQKLFELKQSILMEWAGSYQLAALDMLTKGSLSKKKVQLSIGRAINYMSKALLNGYEVYAKYQKNTWHDLHHLYLMACENKLEHIGIPVKNDLDKTDLSIEDHYKLINLMALSGPNGLRQGEIKRVNEFFKAHLDKIKIVSNPDNVSSKYAHIALLNSDEAAALMPVSEMVNSPTSRLFDLSKVIQALDEFVSLSEDSDLGLHKSQPMLTHSLAKRLAYNLTTIRNRRFKRFPRDENGSLIIRMNNVVDMLRDAHTDSFMDQIDEDVEDDNIYSELSASETIESPWSEIDIDTLDDDKDIEIHTWHIQNSSTGGYGLRQLANETSSARVGELVAIKDPKDTQDQWQIGVIRWMDSIKGKGLSMGLENLSSYGMGFVAEEITNREVTQTFPVEGLYLPKVEGSRDQPNLILPGYIFRTDDIVTITLSSRQEQIKITTVDDTMGSFAYCGFEKLEDDNKPKSEVEEFEDVWEFI